MSKKFWNWVKNEETNETELIFNGPISEESWVGDEITPAMFKAELKKGNVVLHNIIVSTVGNYEAQSYLYNEITKLVDPAIVHRFDAGCVVGAHCGPGTTGLFYLKKAQTKKKGVTL